MSIKKKIMSAVTALALAIGAVSFGGCSQNVNYAMEVDGEQIAAGLYILYSGQALSSAQAKLLKDNPDLDTSAEGFSYDDQTIDGLSFRDYVAQEAVNNCKRYVAVNRLFDELNIPVEADERKNLDDSLNGQWDLDVASWATYLPYVGKHKTLGSYYESIGVSKASLREYLTTSYKASKIFDYYYGEGGIEEVPKADKEKWIDENYALARYFGVSITDSDGKVIESKTELAILEKLAQEYVDSLNDGDSYKDVYDEYQTYVSEQKAATAATTSDAESTAAPEDTTAAARMAPRAAGGETEAVTAAPEETQPEESATAEPDETEPIEVTESGTELSETTPEETTAEATEAVTESSTTATAAETTTDGTGTTTSEAKDSDYDRIIGKDSTSPSKEFVSELFAKDKNTAYMFKADTYYYVVQKLDILNSEDKNYVEEYDSQALSGLKDDDMEGIFEDRYSAYEVVKNSSAPDYCSEQADNAASGLTTVSQIQYLMYYSQMFGSGM